jgi:cell division protein FtsW (lipid II flippase)
MAAIQNTFSRIRRLRWTEFQLLIIPAVLSILGMLLVILIPTSIATNKTAGDIVWHWPDLWMSFLFIALLAGIHLWLNITAPDADQVLLPVVATLTGLGLIMIQRLELSLVPTYGEVYRGVANKQVLWIAAGLVVLWLTLIVSRDLRWLRRYKYTFALLGLALVAATLVFGVEVNGAKLWFNFGGYLSFQPSELLKVILVIFLAGYLDDKRELITPRGPGFQMPPLPYLLPLGIMLLGTLGLFIVQKDLGSALLFFGVFLAMLYMASGRPLYVVSGLAAFLGGAAILYQFFGHVRTRVDTWIDPWFTAPYGGYQTVQALYAFANGGVLGTGIGLGQPGWIPEVHTDFVFAAIGEELGLAGTLATLALYLLMIYRGYHIALHARDGFYQLLAVGLTTVLGLQTLIIVGGVTRLIPLTGITLPFISYGGSSVVINLLIIGLLLRISSVESRSVSRGSPVQPPVVPLR